MLLLGGGAVAVNEDIRRRLLQSTTAKQKGLDNTPPQEMRARLDWLAARAAEILSIVQRIDPSAALGSGYRAPQVNAAVDGSPTSKHMQALAYDITSATKTFEQYAKIARHIRANAAGVSVAPEDVLVERVPLHLHIEYAPPGTRAQTNYRQEIAGRKTGEKRRFEALA